MKPLAFYYTAGNPERKEAGGALLKEGVLASLILAGGEGTRLGWDGPKGTCPVSADGKSLFELFCTRIKAAPCEVPVAIMTSPANSEATHTFFSKHDNFGLREISFFEQGTLPLLDQEKRPTEERGADGNGYALKYLMESGIYTLWKERGIKYIHIILVDNALADPVDAELLGVHATEELDWTIKCIVRKNPQEKAGVLVEKEGTLQIIEYTDLPAEVGSQYALLNTGMYCVSMDLLPKLNYELPLHLAHKKRKGHWYFKQEAFLFDLLPQVKRSAAILYPRAQVFAPLKNREGENGPEAVRQALLDSQQ